MARIEWVSQRLDNWARWKQREQRHGLGFYTQSAFLRIAVDGSGGFREAQIPVDDVEASGTDEAVQALLGSHPHLHRTLVLIYIDDTGQQLAAKRLACALSTVKARLEQADHLIAAFLRLKAQAREEQRLRTEPDKGSFTP